MTLMITHDKEDDDEYCDHVKVYDESHILMGICDWHCPKCGRQYIEDRDLSKCLIHSKDIDMR